MATMQYRFWQSGELCEGCNIAMIQQDRTAQSRLEAPGTCRNPQQAQGVLPEFRSVDHVNKTQTSTTAQLSADTIRKRSSFSGIQTFGVSALHCQQSDGSVGEQGG